VAAPGLDRWTPISSGLPIGVALGAGIWLLSVSVTGQIEPWDSRTMYYPVALIGAGVVGGVLVAGHWVEVAVGIFTGQAVVMLARVLAEPAVGGPWPLGVALLGLYTLLALGGAAAGSRLRRVLDGRPR
jgi:hypothetical protein